MSRETRREWGRERERRRERRREGGRRKKEREVPGPGGQRALSAFLRAVGCGAQDATILGQRASGEAEDVGIKGQPALWGGSGSPKHQSKKQVETHTFFTELSLWGGLGQCRELEAGGGPLRKPQDHGVRGKNNHHLGKGQECPSLPQASKLNVDPKEGISHSKLLFSMLTKDTMNLGWGDSGNHSQI